MDLRIHDISASGAILLTGDEYRVEVGGLLGGDFRERDLSTWSDESLAGIAQDGSAYAGNEESAGAGLEPFFYFRRAGETAPVRLGKGTAIGLSPDGRWVLSEVSSDKGGVAMTLFPTGPGDARPLPVGKVRQRSVNMEYARWSEDGRKLLFPGFEAGRPARSWLLDLDEARPPQPATPEGCSLSVISPDGKSVATMDSSGSMRLFAVSGSAAGQVPGALPGEVPVGWEIGGKALFVWDRTWPARIVRLELDGGRRTAWKELTADPLGLLYGDVILAGDGQHYIYRLRRVISQLYLAEGIR